MGGGGGKGRNLVDVMENGAVAGRSFARVLERSFSRREVSVNVRAAQSGSENVCVCVCVCVSVKGGGGGREGCQEGRETRWLGMSAVQGRTGMLDLKKRERETGQF